MKQLLITIAALVLVGCADPEAEANKLFTEASQLVKDADSINEPYSLEAFYKRKAAIDLIEKIPAQYPQSSLSVEISKGDFKIQSQSIDEIRKKMKPEISIHDAAIDGIIEAVKQHLGAGTDVDEKNKYGDTPLILAANNGHKEIAKLLIVKSADVNAKGSGRGNTPLHNAAIQGHKEIAELLIAESADVNMRQERGWTPLHVATIHGHKEYAELLIAKGADVNAKIVTGQNQGETPLDQAIRSKQSTYEPHRRQADVVADLPRKHGGKTGKELKAEGK